MDARRMLLEKLKDKFKKGPISKDYESDDMPDNDIPSEGLPMKKVTIMSPSTEGLKDGVSKVQEILQKRKDLLDLGKHLSNSAKMIGSENLVPDAEEDSPDDRIKEAALDNPEHEEEGEQSPHLMEMKAKIEDHSPEELHHLKRHIEKLIARK